MRPRGRICILRRGRICVFEDAHAVSTKLWSWPLPCQFSMFNFLKSKTYHIKQTCITEIMLTDAVIDKSKQVKYTQDRVVKLSNLYH